MIIGNKVTNPGELRTEITIETPTLEQDAGGAQSPGWDELDTVKCRWKNVHGSEVWQSQALQAQRPATVLIRYLAAVDERCSILKGSDRYEIVSVDDIEERHEYMELKVQLATGSV